MKIGQWVYLKDGNNVSYGRIIGKMEQEDKDTKYQIECMDDLYYDITEDHIYEHKDDFINSLIYYLKGD